MKLLIDDTTARMHNLNANEACVFAAILKCTKSGRGWFANYRDLANALPFVISRPTTYRAVQKLLNLGLIYEDEKKVLFAVQNEQSAVQNEQKNLPPNNPFIINNEIMNEKEHATCAQACDTRENPIPFWSDIKTAFKEKGGQLPTGAINDIERKAFAAWQHASPAKKIKLLEAVKSGAHFKARLDWLIADFPEPIPDFLRGDETDADIVQVRYNGLFKLCTRETMNLFGLEYVRDWK